MDIMNTLSVLLGSSWTSGVNLYMTVAGLGIAGRQGWIKLPGNLEMLQNPYVIGAAVVLYIIEFGADKVPYIDNTWDSIHTLIRPAGGAALAYLGSADMGQAAQVIAAMLSGSVAMESHLTKAGTRMALNVSPEPVTNTIASVTEDGLVAILLVLIAKYPIIATIVAIIFIIGTFFLLLMVFKFVKKVFGWLFGKKSAPAAAPAVAAPAAAAPAAAAPAAVVQAPVPASVPAPAAAPPPQPPEEQA